MSGTTRSIDIITAEAAEWFSLNQEAELTRKQREQFLAWLSASPLHVEEYLGVAESWGAMQMVDHWPELCDDDKLLAGLEADNVYRMDARAPSPRANGRKEFSWRKLLMPSAAAAVLAVGFVLAIDLVWTVDGSYRTGAGEQRAVVLEDGSILQLNAMTKVRVRFEEDLRRIELTDGEAYFKVAHDATRPFEVVTPEAVVRAVGTAFNVYRREGKLDVAVTEGRVRVTAGRVARASAIVEPVFLSASQGVVMRGDGALARTATTEASPGPAWMQRRLVFNGERLDAVVAEFNRYTKEQLQVRSAELAGLQISGTFNADDPQTLITYLEQMQDVTVDRVDGRTLLKRRGDNVPQQQ